MTEIFICHVPQFQRISIEIQFISSNLAAATGTALTVLREQSAQIARFLPRPGLAVPQSVAETLAKKQFLRLPSLPPGNRLPDNLKIYTPSANARESDNEFRFQCPHSSDSSSCLPGHRFE